MLNVIFKFFTCIAVVDFACIFELGTLLMYKLCFLRYIDKLLETNESMHQLMQKKRQLISRLLQISDEDYDSIAEVCHIVHIYRML